MATACPQRLWITLATLVLLLWTSSARADVVVAPVGGQSVAIGGHRVVCRDANSTLLWSVDTDAKHVRPPAAADAAGQKTTMRVAPDAASCSNSNTVTALDLVAIAGWPQVDPTSVTLSVDAGRVDFKGRNLRGAVFQWTAAGKTGSDACRDPQVNAGVETCAFSVDRDLPADPASVGLVMLPGGVPPTTAGVEVLAYDSAGHAVRSEGVQVAVTRVVLASLVPSDASVDAEADLAHVTLKHAEAIGSVECTDAYCDMDNADVVVRGEHGNDETLDIRVHLRPHVYFQDATGLNPAPVVVVPLQRCPVSVVSAPPLRGISNQQIVLRIGGKCRQETALRFFVAGSAAPITATHQESDAVYTVIRAEAFGGDEVAVSIQRGGSVVGIARARTRNAPTAHARLELPGAGQIDFIPTNRDASVVLPPVTDGAVLVPLPVDGVYSVTHDASGADRVRGLEGTAGWVALRLAYRDKTLPPALRDINLAEITDSVDRAIHAANLPILLGASALSDKPVVELVCGDGEGNTARITPGSITSVPFRARDTCRIVFHREMLRSEDGEQALRLTVSAASPAGVARPEAAVDQRLTLRPGTEPRYVYLGGVVAPFDRLIVRVSLLGDDARYAVGAEDKLAAPQVQWSLIMGTGHVRLYATGALPTGLFRVSDQGHSGSMGLNAGVLMRLVWLSREGIESPIALEGGAMWLGIAGDSTGGSHGQAAVVAGLSIGVPIANPATPMQAAISLHAWVEYEVSRTVLKEAGSPWGFVFGPSISIGDVGMSF